MIEPTGEVSVHAPTGELTTKRERPPVKRRPSRGRPDTGSIPDNQNHSGREKIDYGKEWKDGVYTGKLYYEDDGFMILDMISHDRFYIPFDSDDIRDIEIEGAERINDLVRSMVQFTIENGNCVRIVNQDEVFTVAKGSEIKED